MKMTMGLDVAELSKEQHAEAVRRWRAGEPAWDISDFLRIELRTLLEWTIANPSEFPSLMDEDGAGKPSSPKHNPYKSRTKLRRTGNLDVQLPPRYGPKPATFADLVGRLNLEAIGDALCVESDEAEAALRILYDGGLQQDAMELLGKPYKDICLLCRHIGWTTRWHRVGCRSNGKVGSLVVETVIEMYTEGKSLSEIGRAAGVTRERIRQVCLAEGLKPRSQIIADRCADAAAKKERKKAELVSDRERRRRMRDEQLAAWLDTASMMWTRGATIKQVAAVYNMTTNSFGWYMHAARRRLGAQWFPLRGDTASMSDRIMGESEDLRRRWAAGERLLDIAKEYGWSLKKLQRYMQRVRRKCGYDALPMRSLDNGANSKDEISARRARAQNSLSVDAQRILPMLASGLTSGIVANMLGVPVGRVYSVARWHAHNAGQGEGRMSLVEQGVEPPG